MVGDAGELTAALAGLRTMEQQLIKAAAPGTSAGYESVGHAFLVPLPPRLADCVGSPAAFNHVQRLTVHTAAGVQRLIGLMAALAVTTRREAEVAEARMVRGGGGSREQHAYATAAAAAAGVQELQRYLPSSDELGGLQEAAVELAAALGAVKAMSLPSQDCPGHLMVHLWTLMPLLQVGSMDGGAPAGVCVDVLRLWLWLWLWLQLWQVTVPRCQRVVCFCEVEEQVCLGGCAMMIKPGL